MATLSWKKMKLPLFAHPHRIWWWPCGHNTERYEGTWMRFHLRCWREKRARRERWQHFAAASVNRMDLMGRNVDYPGRTLIPISPRSGVSISLFRLLREISHGAERKTFPIRPPSPPPHTDSYYYVPRRYQTSTTLFTSFYFQFRCIQLEIISSATRSCASLAIFPLFSFILGASSTQRNWKETESLSP